MPNKARMIGHYLLTLCCFVAVVFFCELRTDAKIARAAEAKRAAEFEYWKQQLLPMYAIMGIKYNRSPQTLDELLKPLFGLSRNVGDVGQEPQPLSREAKPRAPHTQPPNKG